MLYGLAVLTRWFCPPKRVESPACVAGTELNATPPAPPPPADPDVPPNSPVIQPIAVAQPTYPDLPTLNPSLVRQEGDDTYSV